jgi:hypothetical protein
VNTLKSNKQLFWPLESQIRAFKISTDLQRPYCKFPKLTIQSAHRWRWGCQPYAPAAIYPQEDSWYSFLLEGESTPGSTEKFYDLIANRTRDLQASSIVPRPITLPLLIWYHWPTDISEVNATWTYKTIYTASPYVALSNIGSLLKACCRNTNTNYKESFANVCGYIVSR